MHRTTLVAAIFTASTSAAQQPPPDYGHNFVTIGDAGNPAYFGTFPDLFYDGRGSVGYNYRVASLEMSSGQYVEFANALNNARVPDLQASLTARGGFTAGRDPDTGLTQFQTLSDEAAMWPVRNIDWQLSAVYCNWLHNGKGSTPDAFLSGAYDVSTFSEDGTTDQTTRSLGARYWIPSVDEWLKAAHYDPDKNAPGDGGWWAYPNGSDTMPVSGLPGEGETSAFLVEQIRQAAWRIPVGSYPEHGSPFGLLDASGGVTEWLEDWAFPGAQQRLIDGESAREDFFPDFDFDLVSEPAGSLSPTSSRDFGGLRIASAVPSPSSVVLFGIALIAGATRRRH